MQRQRCQSFGFYQQMEMEMISQSVTTLGDMGAPTDEEFEKLEEEVAAVREDVADDERGDDDVHTATTTPNPDDDETRTTRHARARASAVCAPLNKNGASERAES